MRIEKQEFGSLCNGKLMKTVYIKLIPEDEEDRRIIRERKTDAIYL